jgi:hypothetical protein
VLNSLGGLRIQLHQVFYWLLSEFIDARLAAEFHVLPLVNNRHRLPHTPQFVPGNDADLQRVRLRLDVLCRHSDSKGAQKNRGDLIGE